MRYRKGSPMTGPGLLAAGLCLVFAILLPADIHALADEGEAALYLQKGEASFRRGMQLDSTDPENARVHYTEAIINFEHIVNEFGIRNGKLYYNIGNAYFRLEDLGRAILNYRRALLYQPNDQNLAQNLEYARSRRVNRVEPTEKDRIFKTLFFLHYDIPSRIRLDVLVVSFCMIWVFSTMFIFLRKGWLRAMIVIASVLSVLFLTSLIVEKAGRRHKPAGVIISSEVTARKGDADTYQPSFTDPLYSGTEFRVLEKRTKWWHIELEDGARCWIPSSAGELVAE